MNSQDGSRICPECETRTRELQCPRCKSTTMPASMVSAGDDLTGTRLGQQYELNAVLGRGGMGVVYRATQLSMDRPVAIKVISSSLTRDLSVVKRFQREARITSKLTHPNTIRVYDFGLTEDGILYLVMELLEGRELSKEIKTVGQMPLARAVSITVQALKSLHEAHGLGIVHRDLKPANIFLQNVAGQEDLVKVMDFGIAKLTQATENTSALTQAGLLVGTPYYMSPEQVRGEEIGPRSDLYALGVIFFQMLTGRVPFMAETPVAVLMAHTSEPIPPVGNLRKDLAGNAPLREALERLMAKDASQRPVSALHAIALLQRLVPAGPDVSNPELTALDTGAFAKLEVSRKQAAPMMDTPASGELKTLARVERRPRETDGPAGPHEATRVVDVVSETDNPQMAEEEENVFASSPSVDTRAATAMAPTPIRDDEVDVEVPTRTRLAATPLEAPPGAPLNRTPTATDPEAAPAAPTPSGAPKPLVLGLAAAAVGLVLGTAAVIITRTPPPPEGSAVSPPVAPTPPEPVVPKVDPASQGASAVAAARKVTLVVDGKPAGASVTLDGKDVGTLPLRHELEAGQPGVVRVVAPGHLGQQRKFDGTADATLTFDLQPEPTTPAKVDKPDKPEKVDKPVKPEKADKPEKVDRPPTKAPAKKTEPARVDKPPKKKKASDADLLEDL